MADQQRAPRRSMVIAAFGFLAFPWMIALGFWRPAEAAAASPKRDLGGFLLALGAPWLFAAALDPFVGVATTVALYYGGALAVVAMRLRWRDQAV